MKHRLLPALCVGLVALGVLLPLWPLCAVGIVLAGLSGRWFAAFTMGLFVDVVWGIPPGSLQYAYVPFTLMAVAAALVRLAADAYVLDRNLPERL